MATGGSTQQHSLGVQLDANNICCVCCKGCGQQRCVCPYVCSVCLCVVWCVFVCKCSVCLCGVCIVRACVCVCDLFNVFVTGMGITDREVYRGIFITLAWLVAYLALIIIFFRRN